MRRLLLGVSLVVIVLMAVSAFGALEVPHGSLIGAAIGALILTAGIWGIHKYGTSTNDGDMGAAFLSLVGTAGGASIFIACVAAGLLAGCALATPSPAADPQIVAKTRVIDTGCEWVGPFYVSKNDTKETKAEALAWDKTWSLNCPEQAAARKATLQPPASSVGVTK